MASTRNNTKKHLMVELKSNSPCLMDDRKRRAKKVAVIFFFLKKSFIIYCCLFFLMCVRVFTFKNEYFEYSLVVIV